MEPPRATREPGRPPLPDVLVRPLPDVHGRPPQAKHGSPGMEETSRPTSLFGEFICAFWRYIFIQNRLKLKRTCIWLFFGPKVWKKILVSC